MTEEQWQACTTNPTWMVNAVHDRVSDRKLRLFAVACARSILSQTREIHRDAVARVANIAEAFAEGTASDADLEAVMQETIPWESEISAAIEACNPDARFAAVRAVQAAADAAWTFSRIRDRLKSSEAKAARRIELERQTALARCVAGIRFARLS